MAKAEQTGVQAPPRIVALHYLRGVGALMVVYAHLISVPIFDAHNPRYYTGLPAGPELFPMRDTMMFRAALAPDWILRAMFSTTAGELGVCLFFLLSGYVIANAVASYSVKDFLWNRVMRIFPCYLAVLTLFILAVRCIGSAWYPAKTIIANAFMAQMFANIPSISPVVWSLVVEMVFYVVICVHMIAFRRLTALNLMISSIAILLVGGASSMLFLNGFKDVRYVSYCLMFVGYIVIGSSIRLLDVHGITRFGVISFIVVVAAALLGRAVYGYAVNEHEISTAAFVSGLSIFIGVLVLRPVIGDNRLFKFLGDISYPLYLIHTVPGWYILYRLSQNGWSLLSSAAVAGVAAVALAYAIHRLVEKPALAAFHHMTGGRRKRLDRVNAPVQL